MKSAKAVKVNQEVSIMPLIRQHGLLVAHALEHLAGEKEYERDNNRREQKKALLTLALSVRQMADVQSPDEIAATSLYLAELSTGEDFEKLIQQAIDSQMSGDIWAGGGIHEVIAMSADFCIRRGNWQRAKELCEFLFDIIRKYNREHEAVDTVADDYALSLHALGMHSAANDAEEFSREIDAHISAAYKHKPTDADKAKTREMVLKYLASIPAKRKGK